MRALIDGDILRYEVGFAAEAGWKATHDDDGTLPSFDYVRGTLLQRIAQIVDGAGASSSTIYITEGRTFRYDLAVTKPYKGQRIDNRPWHYENLTIYMKDVLDAEVVTHIEADDAMAMASVLEEDTIICSRDKDLRQVPGWMYSWELGKQAAFGPKKVGLVGKIQLSDTAPRKITGEGLSFFFSQMLTGDAADNIPGLPGCGPVAAFECLNFGIEHSVNPCEDMENEVAYLYEAYYLGEWEERMLEQGRLLWMTRRFNEDGSPVLWERGMYS